jgi:tripartite-type tricarboxylate transporter receptor subunit TctC
MEMYTSSIRSLLKLVIIIVIFLIPTLFNSNGLSEEHYPNKPITMVISYGVGGMADTVGRAICKAAEKQLNQPIIIENKPGASGTIGMNYVLNSKPDGYTLGTTSTTNYIQTPHLQKYPFNVFTDTTDIAVFCKYNHLLCVRQDAPWNTYEELITYAKKNPGKVTYCIPGIASAMHIVMERIALKEGIKWTAIPFKSGGQSVLAVLGGHVNISTQSSVESSGHIKAGKLKALLVLTDTRLADFPDVPTILEKGYDFCGITYSSIFGPRDLPKPITQTLEGAFKRATEDSSFIETMKRFQIGVFYMSGKEYSKFWRSKYDEMGKVLEALGLKGK